MVDKRRVRRKLPSLLIDEPVTTPQGLNHYRQIDRRLTRLQRRDPRRADSILGQVTLVLERVDQLLMQDTREIAAGFNRMERAFYEPRRKK